VSRILVIEDSRDVAHGLRRNLEVAGHHVYVRFTGRTGLDAARRAIPDLVVLDLMLPGLDGRDVLATLRGEGFRMPILVLTALASESDKVRGFDIGADDYVTKPFGLNELLARVRALLRRPQTFEESGRAIIRVGSVVLDTATRRVSRGGRPMALRPKEYELLLALARRSDAVVSRSELMMEVWGYAADAVSRTLDTHIAMLRRKVEADPSRPRHLLTVRGSGHRLVP
jgi:two-component system, OmpR family, alkaline phosphatase synthesis response regulator PhoP